MLLPEPNSSQFKTDEISGWGGGYIDEPISKILSDLQSAETLQMDRWILKVVRNDECPSTDDRGEDNLPLNVVNNYFSFGVDAQIALQVTPSTHPTC